MSFSKHFAVLFLICFVLIGSYAAAQTQTPTPLTGTDTPVEQLVPEVVSVRRHDTKSFTEGLLLYNGLLYESSGEYGESRVSETDPQTGKILREFHLNEQYFGEGLAQANGSLIQLTWKEGTAIIYDLKTFQPTRAFQYQGEGWGMCYDGQYLWTSDGSHSLFARNLNNFAVAMSSTVKYDGLFIDQLNELECVGDSIYANVWNTDYIVRIDKFTGKVTARIDASHLLTREERAGLDAGAVLNGIAYDAKNDTFLITGKLWPKLFEVKFKPKAG
jgi:glutamine cyclotransferase